MRYPDERMRRGRVLPAKHLAIWDVREMLLVGVPALFVLAAALWFLLRLVQPSPPAVLSIATGGTSGAYHGFGTRYAEILQRSGIRLIVRPTGGSIENLRLLGTPDSDVELALVQGGIATSQPQSGLISLGQAFVEPLWVFYRRTESIDMLHQLKGLRLAVGPEGSGTRHLALTLLRSNTVTEDSATLVPITGKLASDALRRGEVDAVFLAMAPESPVIQALLLDPTIKLMNFSQAEAYTRHMPFLQRIVLPRGGVDLARNIPDQDIALIAPVASLVARETLHPAVAGLLIDALREVHGKGGLFHRFGDFPKVGNPEIDVSAEVERYYAAGPSFLKRFLPFWLATFIERMLVLAVPVAGLMIPMIKGIPLLYKWRVKRRLLYWYARLKVLEGHVAADLTGLGVETQRGEIERIDQAVRVIPVPLGFSEEYYTLRSAIDLVRQRVLAHASGVHPNLT